MSLHPWQYLIGFAILLLLVAIPAMRLYDVLWAKPLLRRLSRRRRTAFSLYVNSVKELLSQLDRETKVRLRKDPVFQGLLAKHESEGGNVKATQRNFERIVEYVQEHWGKDN